MQQTKIFTKRILFALILLATLMMELASQNSSNIYAQTSQSFPLELYRSYGFPPPDDPIQLTEEQLYRWNNLLRPHAEKAASLVNVDVGLIGMWAMIENHISSHMDNCYDGNTNLHSSADFDPNTYCGGWGGNWQVGFGMHPAYEYGYVKEAYERMRPGENIQTIGQRVINTSTDPKRYSSSLPYIFKPYNSSSRFPDVTIDEMIDGAISGNADMRWALGTFMKDDAISAYVIAKKFKSYVDANNQISVASRIEGWAGSYNRQRIINIIAGVYSAGTSSSPSSGNYLTRSKPINIRVGNPPNSAPSDGSLESILSWAQQINDALEFAYWDYTNRMMADICNTSGYCAHQRLGATEAYANGEQLSIQGIYWCTFIVIDSFNLAGKIGLTPEGHLAVVNMIRFFKNTPDYFYLDYQHQPKNTILSQVKPGYAYFLVTSPDLIHTAQEHTGLVKSIYVDQYGNGSLVTVESNAGVKSHTYPIVEWNVLNTHYPLRGFGGIN